MFVRYNVDDGLIDEVRNALKETRTSRFRTQNGIIQFQHLFSPTLLTETRLGVNRSSLHRDTNGTFPGGRFDFGLHRTLQADRGEVEIGTSYGWVQSVTWNKGRHIIKAGGEIRKIDLVLADTGTVTTTFTSRDNFVLNKADSVTFASAQPGLKGLRPYYFTYLQDEIKLSPTLTLSAGARYEYYSVARTADGRGRVLDLERCGGFCAQGTPVVFPRQKQLRAARRIGLGAERFGGKTVLRAGYGIFYAPGQIDDVNAPIDSYPETYTLSTRDNPALAFPATQFLGQAKSTGVSARAQQRDRRDAYAQQWTLSVQQQLAARLRAADGVCGQQRAQAVRAQLHQYDRPADRHAALSHVQQHRYQVELWQQQHAIDAGFDEPLVPQRVPVADAVHVLAQHQRQLGRGRRAEHHDFELPALRSRRCRLGCAPHADYERNLRLPLGRGRKYATRAAGRLMEGWNVSGLGDGARRTAVQRDGESQHGGSSRRSGDHAGQGRASAASRCGGGCQDLYVDESVGDRLAECRPHSGLPAKGTWGSLPRSAVRGSGDVAGGSGGGKKTRIAERHELEFRAELFNLFNRAQYGDAQRQPLEPDDVRHHHLGGERVADGLRRTAADSAHATVQVLMRR